MKGNTSPLTEREIALGGANAFSENRHYRFSETGKQGEYRASCGPLYNAEGAIIGVTIAFRAFPEADEPDSLPWTIPGLRPKNGEALLAFVTASTASALYFLRHGAHLFDDLHELVSALV